MKATIMITNIMMLMVLHTKKSHKRKPRSPELHLKSDSLEIKKHGLMVNIQQQFKLTIIIDEKFKKEVCAELTQ